MEIFFFFPYKKEEVSGVPVLFARLAQHLSKSADTSISVVDYPEGYMAREFRESTMVRVVDFEDGKPLAFPDGSIVVLQSMLPATIPSELAFGSTTRLLFWTLHPSNFVQVAIPSLRDLQTRSILYHRIMTNTLLLPTQRRVREFVRLGIKHGSIIFGDGATFQSTTARLGIRIVAPTTVSMPSGSSDPGARQRQGRLTEDILNIAWLGRIADCKIHILLHTINEAKAFATKTRKKITFRVIGSGAEEWRLNNVASDGEYFRLVREGTITGSDLIAYLCREVDILAAMGTSALEGGAIGIPTLILDMSYGPVPQGYEFKWLFETKNRSMGNLIDPSHISTDRDTFGRKMTEVLDSFDEISRKTYEYCVENHSISAVCKQLLSAINDASLTWGDINPRLLKKGVLRNMWNFWNRFRPA